MNEEEIKARILHKLLRHRRWAAKHTSFNNLPKGFSPNLTKDVKIIGKRLIKDGFLIPKITSYGLEVSLNPKTKKEIIEIVEKYFEVEM